MLRPILAILPKELAYDFLLFTQRNPKPCPILEVSDVGDPYLKKIAKDCNIATDIPKYRIYEKGVMTGEYDSVEQFWRDNLVAFLIGCSFSFEANFWTAVLRYVTLRSTKTFRCILQISTANPPAYFPARWL